MQHKLIRNLRSKAVLLHTHSVVISFSVIERAGMGTRRKEIKGGGGEELRERREEDMFSLSLHHHHLLWCSRTAWIRVKA